MVLEIWQDWAFLGRENWKNLLSIRIYSAIQPRPIYSRKTLSGDERWLLRGETTAKKLTLQRHHSSCIHKVIGQLWKEYLFNCQRHITQDNLMMNMLKVCVNSLLVIQRSIFFNNPKSYDEPNLHQRTSYFLYINKFWETEDGKLFFSRHEVGIKHWLLCTLST